MGKKAKPKKKAAKPKPKAKPKKKAGKSTTKVKKAKATVVDKKANAWFMGAVNSAVKEGKTTKHTSAWFKATGETLAERTARRLQRKERQTKLKAKLKKDDNPGGDSLNILNHLFKKKTDPFM